MSIMADSLVDVATAISSTGIGTIGRSIFIGLMPNSPAVCVTVLPAGGAVLASPVRQAVQVLSLQVMVRDTTFASADAKTWTIYNALADNADVLVTSARGRIEPTSQPILMRDEVGRVVFSMNFQAQAKSIT